MHLHLILCGDKCKYIDFRDIANLQVHLLFLAAGLLEHKKGPSQVFTFFTNPLLCLKQDDFKITLSDDKKVGKNYIKVSLV